MDVVSRVRVRGPLAEHAAGFAGFLAEAGYTPLSAANQVRVLAHLSRWLEGCGLGPGELTGERLGEFLAVRREAGYTCWLSERGLAPLTTFLRGLGVVPAAGPAAPAGAAGPAAGTAPRPRRNAVSGARPRSDSQHLYPASRRAARNSPSRPPVRSSGESPRPSIHRLR